MHGKCTALLDESEILRLDTKRVHNLRRGVGLSHAWLCVSALFPRGREGFA